MKPPTPARSVLALLLSLGVAACGSPPPASQVATVAATPTAPPAATETPVAAASPSPSASTDADELASRAVATIELGGGPDMPTEAFGSLWVLSVDGPLMNDGTEPAVHRIDPATNEVIASVPLPGRLCQGIGASPEALWACGPDGLVRIDPATNEVVATVELPAALVASRIAYGAGTVWAFATSGVAPDSVVRIDPATNSVTATIPLERVAATMAFGFDALWVTSPLDGVVLRVDPAANTVEDWTTGLEAPGWIGIGEESLWVSLHAEEGLQIAEDEPSVARLDPASGDVVAEIATGGSLEISGGIATGGGAVWVRAPEPLLARVDPTTNEVVDRIDTPTGPGDVTFAFDSVWVTTERGEVVRLDP